MYSFHNAPAAKPATDTARPHDGPHAADPPEPQSDGAQVPEEAHSPVTLYGSHYAARIGSVAIGVFESSIGLVESIAQLSTAGMVGCRVA